MKPSKAASELDEKMKAIYEKEEAVSHLTGFKVLGKASTDPYFYAIGLRNGLIIQFEGLNISGPGTILLSAFTIENLPAVQSEDFHGYFSESDRGIEVRISEIVWAIDARS